jgi:hypothetical protein
MATETIEPVVATASGQSPYAPFERLRVSVLGGGLLGLAIGGVGGRLAMFVLRLTSPDSVQGAVSDDGFVIGRVTLGGVVGLCALATVVGIGGALVYRLVAPSLVGPPWLRSLTAAVGSGLVIGAIIVHPDGVDFTLLEPPALAIAFFVAIPAAFGAAIGPLLERWDRRDAWVNHGRRKWLIPLAVLAFGFAAIPLVLIAAAVIIIWAALAPLGPVHAMRTSPVARNLARACWIGIAALGGVALVQDVADIL